MAEPWYVRMFLGLYGAMNPVWEGIGWKIILPTLIILVLSIFSFQAFNQLWITKKARDKANPDQSSQAVCGVKPGWIYVGYVISTIMFSISLFIFVTTFIYRVMLKPWVTGRKTLAEKKKDVALAEKIDKLHKDEEKLAAERLALETGTTTAPAKKEEKDKSDEEKKKDKAEVEKQLREDRLARSEAEADEKEAKARKDLVVAQLERKAAKQRAKEGIAGVAEEGRLARMFSFGKKYKGGKKKKSW